MHNFWQGPFASEIGDGLGEADRVEQLVVGGVGEDEVLAPELALDLVDLPAADLLSELLVLQVHLL